VGCRASSNRVTVIKCHNCQSPTSVWRP
jgi:hypothetical protein